MKKVIESNITRDPKIIVYEEYPSKGRAPVFIKLKERGNMADIYYSHIHYGLSGVYEKKGDTLLFYPKMEYYLNNGNNIYCSLDSTTIPTILTIPHSYLLFDSGIMDITDTRLLKDYWEGLTNDIVESITHLDSTKYIQVFP